MFTDDKGYRVGASGRVNADTKILLIGDSFMEALQVEHDESLAGLLEQRLPEKLGRRVAVRNGAVGDWNPRHYYWQARASLLQESFDLLIVTLYVRNDLIDSPIRPYSPRSPDPVHRLRMPSRLSWDEFIDAILYPINDYLETRSHLFVLAKNSAHPLLMRVGLTADYFPVGFRRSEASSPYWNVTANVCSEIAALGDLHGIETLFVVIPTFIQVDPRKREEFLRGFRVAPDEVDFEQPNRLLGDALLDHELTVLDALATFREARATGTQLFGRVDPHLTPDGHDLLERFIEPHVVTLLEAEILARLNGALAGERTDSYSSSQARSDW
jgi:hypothetical protein